MAEPGVPAPSQPVMDDSTATVPADWGSAPVVVAHATALLAQGRDVIAVNGDLRSPETILADAGVRQLIDFSQPAAVLLLAVLHFVADADRPYEAVRTIVDSLPSGSYPGLVNVTLWRPDRPSGARRSLIYGGVGLKP